jgi:hypothetical protein
MRTMEHLLFADLAIKKRRGPVTAGPSAAPPLPMKCGSEDAPEEEETP